MKTKSELSKLSKRELDVYLKSCNRQKQSSGITVQLELIKRRTRRE